MNKRKPQQQMVSNDKKNEEPSSITIGTTAMRKDNKTRKRWSPESKQSTLDGFFGVSPQPKKKKKGVNQQHHRIDSCFTPSRVSSTTCTDDKQTALTMMTGKELSPASVAQVNDKSSFLRCGDQTLMDFQQKGTDERTMNGPVDASNASFLKDQSLSPSLSNQAHPDSLAHDKVEAAMGTPLSSSSCHELLLEYKTLAETIAEMASTTKRNVKLKALKDLFVNVTRSVGGIGQRHDDNDCMNDSLQSTRTIDLVLGKLSIMTIIGDGINTTSSPRPLQVSGSAVSIAVQTARGASSRKQTSQAYHRTGDMGDVAAEFFESKRKNSASQFFILKDKNRSSSQQRLTVPAVHEMLQSIATVPSGNGSQAARQNLLVKLLRSCRNKDEVRCLVCTLLRNMRLGATIKTVLVALATAFTEELVRCQSQKSGSDNIATERFTSIYNRNAEMVRTLERTFHICPQIPEIAHALLLGGVPYAAKHCTLSMGFPIQPMLANPASSFEQVRDFLKDSRTVHESEEQQQYLPAVLEWKYDGVRCQAHWDGNAIKLFSQHLLETTLQFPDVVNLLLEAKHNAVASFVVDAETLAIVNSAKSEDEIWLLPFQDLSTRRSVTKQEAGDGIVRVCIFCFDLVYLNGRSLLEEPLWRCQGLLHAHFNESAGFQFASSAPLPQYDELLIRNALASAVQGGAEGLMIKLTGEEAECTINNVSSSGSLPTVRTFGYESGMRDKLWLKLKRDYVAGYADTIDVVPIGAWYGSGRKAQRDFLSPVLLSIPEHFSMHELFR